MRSFLGFASYYRSFVLGFSHIAAPLHELTKKGVKFQWSSQCQDAFDKLKERLVSSPVLAYPKNDLIYILDTDASLFGVGAVLSQVDEAGMEVKH